MALWPSLPFGEEPGVWPFEPVDLIVLSEEYGPSDHAVTSGGGCSCVISASQAMEVWESEQSPKEVGDRKGHKGL